MKSSLPFLLLSLFALSLTAKEETDKRPNVLFIVVDDMNWRLGCYGNELAKTPHLDRLARKGVRFDRAYCNFPVCGASRTSFLSGRYPTTTGVLNNGIDPRLALGRDYRFLPEYFRDHGYYTAGVGKIPHTPEHIGSMEWDFHRDPQWEPEHVFEGINAAKETRSWPAEKHPDGVTARLAAQLLAEERDQPLFLAVGFHRPHAPRAAPQEYWDKFEPDSFPVPPPGSMTAGIPDIAIPPNFQPDYQEAKIRHTLHAYHATSAFVDAQAGLIFDVLDRKQLWDETIVVFFSDHGVHLGEHGGFWGKMSLMEDSLRVPLLMHLPGGRSGGASAAPVELIDLFPTLTEACGLPPQAGVEGQSLVPLLKDPNATRSKDAVFGLTRRKDGKKDTLAHTVRTRDWAYTEWPDGSRQLYNHANDPGERNNLAGNSGHRATEKRLAALLRNHREQHPLATEPKRKPNIVVILADDLGYEDLGVHGSPEALTPHIDSLAANGIRCTAAYVTAPVCSPSRAALLTGRYQNRFGFEYLAAPETTGPPDRKVGLDVNEVTIADRLKALGYITGCVGKWHVGYGEEFLPMNRGFDEFYGTQGQSGYYTPMLIDSRKGPKARKVRTPGYYVTDDYTRRAVEFIHDHAERPFFLYLSHFAVHKPHDATPKYLARFPGIEDPTRRAYLAMLSALDDGVGEVMKALRETDTEDNTLVIFLSDNGGTQGSSNKPLRGRKGGTWEGGIRVPFLAQWKSQLPAGKTYERPIIALDILPTSVAAAGGTIDPRWNLDGVNLLPHFDGSAKGPPHEALYWKFGTQWAIRRGNWKLLQAREGKGGSIQIAKEGPIRLFNIKEDISEKNDQAAAKPNHVAKLHRQWKAWATGLPEPKWFPKPVE